MKQVLGLLGVMIVTLLLRSTALTALASRGIVIDVLAFATVVWALKYEAAWGATFGFALGIAADLDAVHWLGRHALFLSLLGYGIGRLSRTLVRESVRTQAVLTLLATVLHQAWTAAFDLPGFTGLPYDARRIILGALVTPSLGVLLLSLIRLVTGQPLFSHVPAEPHATS